MATPWLILTMLAASGAAPQPVGPMSSARLANLCSGSAPVQSVLCATYLQGAVDGLVSAEMILTGGDPDFCIPDDGMTLANFRDVFLRYMVQAPELDDAPAGQALLLSLGDRYPCPGVDDLDDGGPVQVASLSTARRHLGARNAAFRQRPASVRSRMRISR